MRLYILGLTKNIN
jgi:hypothetical protein